MVREFVNLRVRQRHLIMHSLFNYLDSPCNSWTRRPHQHKFQLLRNISEDLRASRQRACAELGYPKDEQWYKKLEKWHRWHELEVFFSPWSQFGCSGLVGRGGKRGGLLGNLDLPRQWVWPKAPETKIRFSLKILNVHCAQHLKNQKWMKNGALKK